MFKEVYDHQKDLKEKEEHRKARVKEEDRGRQIAMKKRREEEENRKVAEMQKMEKEYEKLRDQIVNNIRIKDISEIGSYKNELEYLETCFNEESKEKEEKIQNLKEEIKELKEELQKQKYLEEHKEESPFDGKSELVSVQSTAAEDDDEVDIERHASNFPMGNMKKERVNEMQSKACQESKQKNIKMNVLLANCLASIERISK